MPPILNTDKEDKVKSEVKRALNVYKSDVYWFMPAANGFGRVGIPDFVGSVLGEFFAVECKRPSNKNGLTANQIKERDAILGAASVWFLVYDNESLDMFKHWLSVTRTKRMMHFFNGEGSAP